MRLPPYYPKAEWRPSPNFYTHFTLKAAVGHSAHAPLHADPPPRFFNAMAPDRGSTHNWIKGNGQFIQMVRYDNGAFGNGVLNRADGAQSPNALVRGWYTSGRNPNYDTISTEFTGYGVSGDFTPITDDQWDSWFRFLDWCASEGVEFTGDAMLIHQDISATACPDGRFTAADLLRKVKDEVTREEYDALVRDIWGTEAERERLKALGVVSLAERLNNLESNDGPIGKRLARLETDLTAHRNAPHTGNGILDELGDALIRAGEDLKA